MFSNFALKRGQIIKKQPVRQLKVSMWAVIFSSQKIIVTIWFTVFYSLEIAFFFSVFHRRFRAFVVRPAAAFGNSC